MPVHNKLVQRITEKIVEKIVRVKRSRLLFGTKRVNVAISKKHCLCTYVIRKF